MTIPKKEQEAPREEPEVGREWIERIDNPELSDSEREWLENEADFYSRYDRQEAYLREHGLWDNDFDPMEGP